LILISACGTSKKATAPVSAVLPKAEREFRAAWVATVANINWPSKPGLSTEEQKNEALVLLDFLQAHNFNAVIFQVRPQADALYKSDLEPWSYYLTGVQGKAPDPYYDPLEFWTEAAHDRGLELHVWLNPYRAHHISGGEVTETSVVKRMPSLVKQLKQGYWWFDPALKGTQDHSAAVVRDLVSRYDIDGVHFDDYFYPYPEYNKGEDFPDADSYAAFQAAGGKLSRGDWRRNAVNTFIKRVYNETKSIKPWVKFGLSPFGMWKPGYPESITGFDQYDVLYADAKLWLNEGWIDYFSPQLYWPISRIAQSFPVLLGWWQGENTKQRHLWPGMSVGRDTSKASVNETINQIMITRGMVPQSKGAIHWSISSDTRNASLQKALLDGPYRQKALIPESQWLDDQAPAEPAVTTTSSADSVSASWNHSNPKDVFHWVAYYKYGNGWSYKILNRGERTINLAKTIKANNKDQTLTSVIVTAVDRVGNESRKKELAIGK
jgi:uncharacterized lipoprotein YddW (UPF0748 family)